MAKPTIGLGWLSRVFNLAIDGELVLDSLKAPHCVLTLYPLLRLLDQPRKTGTHPVIACVIGGNKLLAVTESPLFKTLQMI